MLIHEYQARELLQTRKEVTGILLCLPVPWVLNSWAHVSTQKLFCVHIFLGYAHHY